MRLFPGCVFIVGGHIAAVTAEEWLEHGDGAIDGILRGEGEAVVADLLFAAAEDRSAVTQVPGAVTADGEGPRPGFVESLDDLRPARDLVRHRRKYFTGTLDPPPSNECYRGRQWDCNCLRARSCACGPSRKQ